MQILSIPSSLLIKSLVICSLTDIALKSLIEDLNSSILSSEIFSVATLAENAIFFSAGANPKK